MYRKADEQHSVYDFISPLGRGLNPNNRWVKLADQIPWDYVEQEYAKNFKPDGAPAIPARMAFGSLVIQTRMGTSDEETRQLIIENLYLQYFIGLTEFQTEPPFDTSMMHHFRKRIPADMIRRINEETLHPGTHTKNDDDQDDPPTGASTTPDEHTEEPPANKGNLIMDATCTPANIKYPTDLSLLNEAREKLEKFIDWLHKPLKNIQDKPRTYRNKARKNYLTIAKSRRPGKKKIRRGIKQQLGYVKRNLTAIDTLLLDERSQPLTDKQAEMLETIRTLYEQQRTMYEQGTHSIDDRIVSLHQPHVRPIVRGKVNQPTEFGAKVSISLVDGYTYTERISWDNFNESTDLILAVERYLERHGCYPEAVIVDKIYRNRKNIAYCKEKGIRISGPALGRKNKALAKVQQAQERLDESIRNAVEGAFGVGKRCYGLDRIMTKLKETSETMIEMGFYTMNLEKKLRVLLTLFTKSACFWLKRLLYRPSCFIECYMAV